MLKYHVKTDGGGETRPPLSDDCVAVGTNMDKDLKPNTDYTVTVTEGKPQRYPRYFVSNSTHASYLRFDSSSQDPVAITDHGIEIPIPRRLQNVEKDDGYREVSYEQAEAHIQQDKNVCSACGTMLTEDERDSNGGLCHECNKKTEPETCVWTRKEADNMWLVGCLRSGFGIQMAIGYRWCPFCRLQIEFRNPHQNPEENREPAIPDGYREPEEWEKQCAKPPVRVAVLDAKDRGWLEVYGKEDWYANNSRVLKIAVPEDFSVMPKCRDCGNPTELTNWFIEGGHGFAVTCKMNKLQCTRGRICNEKAKAVTAYWK